MVMTCNNDLNIKEINNLKWANKLGTSFKKIGLEAFCIKGSAQAPLIKNYSINSAKWTYGCGSFPELPGASRIERGNDSIHGHRGTYFHLPIKSGVCLCVCVFPHACVCVCSYFLCVGYQTPHSTRKVGTCLQERTFCLVLRTLDCLRDKTQL